jgi:alpha-tubulin suppressor-like RCC1 family protein
MSTLVDHSCAILDNGSVKCWGYNSWGELGLGDKAPRGTNASNLDDHLPAVDLGTGRTARAISTGRLHSCALLDDGSVKCWGLNDEGQLGLGDVLNRGDELGEMGDNLPAVDLGTGRKVTAVAAGAQHTCALLDNGSVKCWGSNIYGYLGLGDTLSRGAGPSEMGDNLPAVSLGIGRTAVSVAASYSHTCALLDNGTVKCWGNNPYGELGLGDTLGRGRNDSDMGDNLPVVNLGTGRLAVGISAGSFYSCALLDTNDVKCWGANDRGQLGLGDTLFRGDQPDEMGENLPTVQLWGP